MPLSSSFTIDHIGLDPNSPREMEYRARNRPPYAPAPHQCLGLTSSGRCPSSHEFEGFCSAHKEQEMWLHPRVSLISAAERRAHAESRLCCGLTKKYALCRRNPGGNFRFCYLHGGQQPLNVGAATTPEPQPTSIIRQRMLEFHRIQRESQAREYEARDRLALAEQRCRELEREQAETRREEQEQEQRRAREEEDARRERLRQEQVLEAPSTPEPEAAAGSRNHIPGEVEDDCPICYDGMNAATEMLTFCAECGNGVHVECFAQCEETNMRERGQDDHMYLLSCGMAECHGGGRACLGGGRACLGGGQACLGGGRACLGRACRGGGRACLGQACLAGRACLGLWRTHNVRMGMTSQF
ncbi:hypothetical protein GGX14DRAFT_698911 [Mycena pura]|uniref:Uncharacterized protein n=1 Tax=Mycena pura TaxID=153505 RepID=A0AAD6V8E2_9AGAR|nr:hypothetical protein GGX14DRAFT_698911 [Mycena pura]